MTGGPFQTGSRNPDDDIKSMCIGSSSMSIETPLAPASLDKVNCQPILTRFTKSEEQICCLRGPSKRIAYGICSSKEVEVVDILPTQKASRVP